MAVALPISPSPPLIAAIFPSKIRLIPSNLFYFTTYLFTQGFLCTIRFSICTPYSSGSHKIRDTSDGFFFALASSPKAICSIDYKRFSIFDITKNNRVIHITKWFSPNLIWLNNFFPSASCISYFPYPPDVTNLLRCHPGKRYAAELPAQKGIF